MTDFKIIFVHGYTASPKKDWYPQISKELDKLDVDYAIPYLPGGRRPKAKKWIEIIHKEVKKVNKPIVLAGHSLGTRAILLYLEKYPRKVKRVFLIAAFANRAKIALKKDEFFSDFFTHKIDLAKIKPLVGKFIVMHSKDDISIPYQQGVEISRDLGAELLTFHDRDHFGNPENAKYVLEVLRRELGFCI